MSETLKTRLPEQMFEPQGQNLVFELTESQYSDLKQNIKDRGYLASAPVVISAGPFGEGRILDGFHRSKICAELGIEPVTVRQVVQDEDEFTVLSIELNASGRQMSGAQIVYLRNKHRASYDAIAKRLQVEGGRAGGLGGKGQANLPEASATMAAVKGIQTRDRIAAGTGIKGRTAQKLMTVFDEADETTVNEVLAGRMSPDKAYKKVRPPAEQEKLDTSIKNEAAAAAELEDHFAPAESTQTDAQERVVGNAVRLAIELDKLIQQHRLMDQDVLEYAARPFTFAGTARRLADWFDLTAEVLELNRSSK